MNAIEDTKLMIESNIKKVYDNHANLEVNL